MSGDDLYRACASRVILSDGLGNEMCIRDRISNLSKVADATLIATTDEKNGQRVSTVQRWSQKENIAIPDSEMKQEEV